MSLEDDSVSAFSTDRTEPRPEPGSDEKTFVLEDMGIIDGKRHYATPWAVDRGITDQDNGGNYINAGLIGSQQFPVTETNIEGDECYVVRGPDNVIATRYFTLKRRVGGSQIEVIVPGKQLRKEIPAHLADRLDDATQGGMYRTNPLDVGPEHPE